MPYRITDIILNIEPSKITISTNLQYYTVIPEQVIPDPPNPDIIIEEYDRVDWTKTISVSTKADPFDNTSLNNARPILADLMMEQMKREKRLRDKEFQIAGSAWITNLKASIQAKLDTIP